MQDNSTAKTVSDKTDKPFKPSKPSHDFPLFAHATGRWAKKIGGKTRYFGSWSDPEAALRRYDAFISEVSQEGSDRCPTLLSNEDKPAKPYPDFPLFPHATKRWAKKIRGNTHYFGPWEDPDGALEKYMAQKDALHAGRTPREDTGCITIKVLVNAFLNHKEASVDSGELESRTFGDYKETCDMLVDEFGKCRIVMDLVPTDFAKLRKKMSSRWGLFRLAKNIQYTRSVFKYGLESGMIDKPICFGPGFERPSKKNFRLERARKGVQLFSREEILKILAAATQPLKAMILLGINCGFGNADCGLLPISAINLESGWHTFARPKTGLDRRCPLWLETIAAIKEWLSERPSPKEDKCSDLVFVTAKGGCWAKDTSDNPVSKETAKLLKKLGIKNRNFYTLRHTHRTVSDESCDQRASGYIMGHVDINMAAMYVERISDARLLAVSNRVHDWLFNPDSNP